VRNILHGPLPENFSNLIDAGLWRKLPYALLLASLFLFGIWPRLLTEKITPDAQKIVQSFQSSVSSVQPPNAVQLKTESLKLETVSISNPQSSTRN
jgi:NADH:ubiquinone oxidoreductase subunit 4 (subunit M)